MMISKLQAQQITILLKLTSSICSQHKVLYALCIKSSCFNFFLSLDLAASWEFDILSCRYPRPVNYSLYTLAG